MKDGLIRIYYFFAIFIYAIGLIGGFCTSLSHKEYIYAATTLVLAAMAFPVVKDYFNKLKD